MGARFPKLLDHTISVNTYFTGLITLGITLAYIALPSFKTSYQCTAGHREHRMILFTCITMEDGDIVDCFDLYDQPAFSNPLLKYHKIEKNYPTKITGTKSSSKIVKHWLRNDDGCPNGTVPIIRMNQSVDANVVATKGFGRKSSHGGVNVFETKNSDEEVVPEAAYAYSRQMRYLGTRAKMSVWKVQVEGNEYSYSYILVGSSNDTADPEPNSNSPLNNQIMTGWLIYPSIFHDLEPRTFVYWTKDAGESGCVNNLLGCTGYIHTNQQIPIGRRIPPSIEGGEQRAVSFLIERGSTSMNWWVSIDDIQLGYFPSELFVQFPTGDEVQWGGQILNTNPNGKHTTTQMGSGHFPDEGEDKSGMMVSVFSVNENHVLFYDEPMGASVDRPSCYNYNPDGKSTIDDGFMFRYGGPGGHNC